MDLDKVFGTDKDLEEEGVWVTLSSTSAIKVARLNNKEFKKQSVKIVSRQSKIVSRHLDDIPDDTLIQLLAKTILLDWRGVKIKDKDVSYSYENAVKVLTDYKDFRNLVIELSNEKETFRRKEIEEGKEELKKS